MARGIHQLRPLTVERSIKPGRYSDGGGLYLVVSKSGAKSWAFMYAQGGKRGGKRRELGLGSLHDVPLTDARAKAAKLRSVLDKGGDPQAERDRQRVAGAPAVTFKAAAEQYIAAHKASWRNAKHAQQWTNTLKTYAQPTLGKLAVSAIGVQDVLQVLSPIWVKKTETASRVRGRIETVLDYSKVRGWRAGDNPARWKGNLDQLLPARGKVRKTRNHPACVVDDAPTLYGRLTKSVGTAAAATRYCLLTAARPGEAARGRWPEIDRVAAVWTVPPSRQKSGKPHRVPLSDEAVAVLDEMWGRRESDDGYIFPGAKRGRPLSLTALQKALRVAMGKDLRSDQEGRAATTHGTARSTFDDWASERTHHPQKLIDRALAHGPKSKTKAAYRRSELLEQRKPLMADWAMFLSSDRATRDNVVPLRSAA